MGFPFDHNYLINIKDNLKKVENKIYPENEKIFNAFNYFNKSDLKVVIIGQDCYMVKVKQMDYVFL